MAKRNRPMDPRDPRGPEMSDGSGSQSAGIVRMATLVGVGVLVLMNVKTMTDNAAFKKSLSENSARVADLDNRLTNQLTQVQNAVKSAAAPPQRGPDPNKVYTIKMEGAPSEGPATAPIVIAEFSDFQ